jgi:sugar O-acyltransferase (sialic acid O-acetyltransferase NeuD family)
VRPAVHSDIVVQRRPVADRVVIVGAGGHGAELASYVGDIIRNGWDGQLLGFLDDAGAPPRGMSLLGTLGALVGQPSGFFDGLQYLTGVGNNSVRQALVTRLNELYRSLGLSAWTLVHPTSYVGKHVEIGEGSCLAPGAIVTARAQIGRHCILNIKASVSHDCSIGDFVNINPGATICGNVVVGEGAYIGAGATIKDKVSIGAWSIVGAGAVVIDDVPPGVTAVGVPARVIRKHDV